MAGYAYTALHGGEVRLLRMTSNSDSAEDDQVSGSLEIHALDECPQYTALSYCWGQGAPARSLILNGQSLSVGENLYSFLLQSKKHRQGSAEAIPNLWSDAICIDQQRSDEKNAQVALMRDIYASASRIVIWLGQGDDSSSRAMGAWQRLAPPLRDGQELGPRLGLTEAELEALHGLQRRAYWNRVWVLQEASTAGVPREIWCGARRVALDDALVVNEAARQWIVALGHIPTPNPWIAELATIDAFETLRMRRRRQWLEDGEGDAAEAHGLLSILYMTRDRQATDVRDKIYALLPIYADVHGGPLPLPLAAEYDKPVEETYQKTAAFILNQEQDVRIFLLCSLSGPLGSLYSWVPNFKHVAEPFAIFDCQDQFRASGALPPRVSVDASLRLATFRGARLGTVVAVHSPLAEPGDQASSAATAAWQPAFSAWMRSLAAFLFPDKVDRPYVGGGLASRAVDRLLALDLCPGVVLERTGTVARWPFLAVAAGAEPPRLDDVPASFADLLLRVGHASVFRSQSGHLGVGDAAVRAGDRVVACFGLSVPLLVRLGGVVNRLVGPCFVQGMMDGEGLGGMAEDFEVY